ncbi:hypothetical protein HID58_083893 [Brassica napus]|uniref:BnaCnng08540D protein n=2 Tax=Brassica napus TaxID=3708 RepID=A0A078HMD3_BRANA|nr:hypothetical protein HID58_083893 [Brassica napus]CAF2117017.1 unnamed protein product [Brassica napus]CDY37993.1 BnaCnng08540D [Brassica napus]
MGYRTNYIRFCLLAQLRSLIFIFHTQVTTAQIGDQNGDGEEGRSDEEDESHRNHPKIRICGMVFVNPIC